MDVMHDADAVPADVHHNPGISGSQAAGQISPHHHYGVDTFVGTATAPTPVAPATMTTLVMH
jgi:hypothetical protein